MSAEAQARAADEDVSSRTTVGSWVIGGKDKLLEVDPEKWKKTYDAAVEVKAAKAGVDVTKNVVAGMTS
jgi:hypothetical protein